MTRGGGRDRTARVAALIVIAVTSVACATAVATAVAPPGAPASTTTTGSTTGSTSDDSGRRPGVFPSTRVEPPTDADRPDGPDPTPDSALTTADLTALIRIDASDPPATGRCTPGELRLTLESIEAAAGHRYALLTATNTGRRSCSLLGWPGLGFRGGWGTAFPLVAERSTTRPDRAGDRPADPSQPAVLEPQGSARAEFEWTGALAGAREEQVSLIAVRLVADGPVATLEFPADDRLDLGTGTTVRIGRWLPGR